MSLLTTALARQFFRWLVSASCCVHVAAMILLNSIPAYGGSTWVARGAASDPWSPPLDWPRYRYLGTVPCAYYSAPCSV